MNAVTLVGFGFDVHQLAIGRKLILGGIEIPSELGIIAHSDGDVLLHALMDALLGGAGLGDIGFHFPDTDDEWKGASSIAMLEKVLAMLKKENLQVINVDMTLVLEKPKIAPYKDQIRENIAKTLNLDLKRVSIKATTNEKMGFIGRQEGITAYAICSLLGNI